METATSHRPLRLLVVDRHKIVRKSIRHFCLHRPDFCVVAEAWDGKEALDLYRICRPDVVVMDVMMPGAGGIPATTLIREQDPHAHILPSTTLLDAQFGALVRAGGLDGQPLPSRLSTLALAILDAHGSTPKSLEPGSC